MNEKGLIEQVLKLINSNYSNIYVIDIPCDNVYVFNFDANNNLVIQDEMPYTKFIDEANAFVNREDLSGYFNAISLNTLENENQKGNSETKIKYRKLCPTGEYRWFVNIINYLPFEDKKLIFMMSEDVNDRLTDVEENVNNLSNQVNTYKEQLNKENESISNAIYQINNLLDNSQANGSLGETRTYINSIFNNVSVDHPELNEAIMKQMAVSANYKKPSILIVDDSSIIRNSLKRIFSQDYEIIMAKDGAEAIQIMKDNILSHDMTTVKENIVGVLLDLVMPNVDGFGVLDFMKENYLFTRVPVAIISGDETRETRKKVYQYEIVDMLEKPFNTEQIRRRIGKLINLFMSSNNLQSIVEVQNEELKVTEQSKSLEELKVVVNQIVQNILNNPESTRLKKMVRLLSISLGNKFPKYNIDSKFVDSMINNCALYNIGAIAMNNDVVITGTSIKQEIEYGLSITKNIIEDEAERQVADNIIKYSCELYGGGGYPNGVSGDDIPVEAQIVNIVVRISQYSKSKGIQGAIKNILTLEANKYNPDLLAALEDCKEDLKDIN